MPFLDDFIQDLDEEDRQKAMAKGLTEEEWQARRQTEIEQNRVRLEEIEAQIQEERKQKVQNERAEEDLGQRLGLGVPVRPAYTIRLDGLSRNSRNTGSTMASVTHLYVLGRLERGRLKREPYQFLCNTQLRPYNIGLEPIETDITCPTCRRIAGLKQDNTKRE